MQLKTIISYLKNPMDVGVHHEKILVDFSQMVPFLNILQSEYIDSLRKLGKYVAPKSVQREKEEKFRENISKLEYIYSDEYFDILLELVDFFVGLPSFPSELEPFFGGPRRGLLTGDIFLPKGHDVHDIPSRNLFFSRTIPKKKDVILIDKKFFGTSKCVFDITCIKEDTTDDFIAFLNSFPPLKDRVVLVKKKKYHSQRFVLTPYNLAVKLWINDESSSILPSDLRSYLKGAISYLELGEWRTSIIFSAICTESILADLFEEIFKKEAPDVPLGELFRQVKERISLSSEIISAIRMTNAARIEAVHRSHFPISNREAIFALYGSIKITAWYMLDY